jgi:hypothetical protein
MTAEDIALLVMGSPRGRVAGRHADLLGDCAEYASLWQHHIDSLRLS